MRGALSREQQARVTGKIDATKGHQWLFELACSGPVDSLTRPIATFDPGRGSGSTSGYSGAGGGAGLSHDGFRHGTGGVIHGACIADVRSHGKVYCPPDITGQQAASREFERWRIAAHLVARGSARPGFCDRPPPQHVLREPEKQSS